MKKYVERAKHACASMLPACGMLLCILLLRPERLLAQSCAERITGTVRDNSGQPVAGAAITLKGSQTEATLTDTAGLFTIGRLCPGIYTLSCVVEGYKPFSEPVTLPLRGKPVLIRMQASSEQLAEVIVEGARQQEIATAAHAGLAGKALLQTRGESLGASLKELAGVNALQSGPTLFKPMIHGLTENRVLLMNNGVRQEGQQWGEDHAPEIDPFTADKITVLKGAASIRYGSDAIAGVVLIDPADLPDQKGIGGNLNLVAASNGYMGTLSGDLEGAFDKKWKGLSWRVQGTLQRAGNFSTPHYYLTNTGLAEGDFSARLGYKWKRLDLGVSYSEYNSKIGIFAGSEAGNAADLMDIYLHHRDQPLVPDVFTYTIGREYQTVNHDMLKANARYAFANKGSLELTYARQRDLRQEYSADLAYSQDSSVLNIPDDWFKLITHTLDLVYNEPYRHGFSGSAGISGSTQGNIFRGLDPLPLIPNYRNYGVGAFAIERYEHHKWLFEGGLRYDYLWRRVYRLDENSLHIYYSTYSYNNVTGTLGATYTLNRHLSLNANFGMGWRPPSAEEMFIHGVHFSAAKYEIGDSSLTSERSYNTTLSVNYQTERLRVMLDMYDNEINHFIYGNPIGNITTIGGGYYAYQYVQDNVSLLGADITLQWDMLKQLSLASKTSLLRATNRTRGGGLINMPPARFQNSLTGHIPVWGRLKAPYFTLENVSVLKQHYIAAGQRDLLPPPPAAYSLWNISLGCTFPMGKKSLDLNFAVDNLTNRVYSDYMNQFRYFAYDLGINFMLRAKFSF